MNDFCDPAKKLLKPGGHGYMFFYPSALFVLAKTSVHDRKEGAANDVQREKVERMEAEMSVVERTTLMYSQAPGHYRPNPRSNRLNHTSVVEQSVHFLRKVPSFSDAIDYVYYDAPEEVAPTHPG